MENIRLFEFKRGSKFKCIVVVRDGAVDGYIDTSFPDDCSQEVSDAFLAEAETAVTKRLEREHGKV